MVTWRFNYVAEIIFSGSRLLQRQVAHGNLKILNAMNAEAETGNDEYSRLSVHTKKQFIYLIPTKILVQWRIVVLSWKEGTTSTN